MPRVASTVSIQLERGYLDVNSAHGIRLRDVNGKAQRRFYSPAQIRDRTVVTVADHAPDIRRVKGIRRLSQATFRE